MTLVYIGIFWLLGILLTEAAAPPWPVLAFVALPAIAAIALWPKSTRVRLMCICVLAMVAGGARVLLSPLTADRSDVTHFAGTGTVAVTGIASLPPEVRDGYQQVLLEVSSASGSGCGATPTDDSPVTGSLLVRVSPYRALAYGDEVCVSGQIRRPLATVDNSYGQYLARKRIFATMPFGQLETVEAGHGAFPWTILYSVKSDATDTVRHILAEPYAGLLAGILLGDDSGIPKALYDKFNTVGASHIIVVSGSNIAVVCGLLMAAGIRVVGKRRAVWLTVGGIVLYAVLVGADPPVLRAAVMGVLSVLAVRLGRETEARILLVLAATFLTVFNPHFVMDTGFQLSFAASAGLVWLSPPLQRALNRLIAVLAGQAWAQAAERFVADVLAVTLAAQVAVTPLLAYHFGRLSPVSLVANLLIVPVQPFILMFGALATFAGSLWLPLGRMVAFLAWLPLAWTVKVVESAASVPGASITLRPATSAAIVALTAGLVLAVWGVTRRTAPTAASASNAAAHRLSASTRWLLIGAAVLALLPWLAVNALPDGRLHVDFLDVGQGDAILITTPNGRQVLVDGGPAPSVLLWRVGERLPFWDHSIDLVVSTHPDVDHLGGLPAVFERFRVPNVFLSDVEGSVQAWTSLRQAIDTEGSSVTVAHAGDRIHFQDGAVIDVLHPGRATAGGNTNSRSVVLRISYGGTSFLLTGDIDAGTEQGLAEAGLLMATTVVKAPHHGSGQSSSRDLLEATHPQLAIVSVGAQNSFGHPAPEVLQRFEDAGIPVLRTDQVGTIECTTDGRTLWVRSDHAAP